MTSIHRRGPRSTLGSLASLTLFLVGGNYCMLAAWGGDTRMACSSITPLMNESACCHEPDPSSRSGTEPPSTSHSCFPDPVVAPSGVSLDRVFSGTTVLPISEAPLTAGPEIAAAAEERPLPMPPNGQPPTAPTRAATSARAPPLS